MAVKIRLARIGRKKDPVYRLVAMNERDRRDGASLEVLGTYDPLKEKLVQFHAERFAYWQSQGAVETPAVKKIYRNHAQTFQKKSEAAVTV